MSHYLVVGLGKTGHSIARYLQRHHLDFSVFDTREQTEAVAPFHLEFPDIDLYLGEFPEEKLAQISEIIVSPGVPLETPCLVAAKALGLPIYGDIECLARNLDARVIAITGTNGKSTVTTLVGLMAHTFGLKTAVAGNIGMPVLDLLADDIDYDLWVLELSSFQLDLIESLQPIAATMLNITPDHLDRHHTLEAYIAAKQRVYHQAQCMVYNREDAVTQPWDPAKAKSISSFGLNEAIEGQWGLILDQEETFLAYGKTKLLSVDELRIQGRHNWANALAACAVAHAAGISFAAMQDVLKTFAGLPHRTQWVRTFNDVNWINDSKGTNIGATQSAIAGIGGAISGKIVLIAGGQGKGADFRELRAVVSTHVRILIVLGEDAPKLEAALLDLVEVKRVVTLEDAVDEAYHAARAGDVVLLSPACASLDMFRDFNHRGEMFADLVGAL
ncbi:MAG: UDP-N-acetylmuramoyl-L-alanine--D-glutamate ligase [Legionella sp.]|nr:MAG: UDP-N-acetylmuramoyl-L-alanine--D-glutamate ligase [Legionella sp.]